MPVVDSSPSISSILPTPPPRFRATDANGAPLVGGQLFAYQAGTVTPLATFDGSGAANTNPVLLDANGEASVRLGPGPYKFVLEDADGNQLWAEDNIPGSGWAISANPSAPQTIAGQKLIAEVGFEGAIGVESPESGRFSSLEVTASTSTQRLMNVPGLGQVIGANLNEDGVTRDEVGRWGYGLAFDTINGGTKLRVVSPGGTVKDYAPRLTAGADFTQHVNTGNTTENTLVSRTIVGNTLGASGGLRIRCYVNVSAQGASGSVVRLYANGTQIAAFTIASGNTGIYKWEVTIGNHTATSQFVYALPMFFGAAPALLTGTASGFAIDTTVDVALDVRVQNGQTTDSINLDMMEAELVNTFAM